MNNQTNFTDHKKFRPIYYSLSLQPNDAPVTTTTKRTNITRDIVGEH